MPSRDVEGGIGCHAGLEFVISVCVVWQLRKHISILGRFFWQDKARGIVQDGVEGVHEEIVLEPKNSETAGGALACFRTLG